MKYTIQQYKSAGPGLGLVKLVLDTNNKWVLATKSAMYFRTKLEARIFYNVHCGGFELGPTAFIVGPRGGHYAIWNVK